MSANPRWVLVGLYVPWPSSQYAVWVRAGALVDIVPGSAHELAYGGPTNLTPVGSWVAMTTVSTSHA